MTARRAAKPAKQPQVDAQRGARVVRFFERYLTHHKGRWARQPFVLEPWQRRDIIEPLFGTMDRRGRRKYREALIGIPRKNGKSELAAGLALYGLFADGEYGAEVYSVAGSRDQARIVFSTARQMVLASAFLNGMAKIYRDAIEVPETGSVYRVLSSDAGLAHGYNPHFVVVDELHVHKTPDLYEAMRSGTAARDQPMLLSITTAGWDRKSLCWKLYQHGKKGGDAQFFFRWWELPEDGSLANSKHLRQANPASWVTIEFLKSQARAGGLPENVVRRLHGNQWTLTDDIWIRPALWDRCAGKPSIPVGSDVVIGVDAAPKKDSTAVVVVRRDDDGKHHWMVRIFQPDEATGYLNFGLLADYIRELAEVFNVRRIAFDPFTVMQLMLDLHDEGLPVEEFPQNHARMVPASQNLYDLVTDQRLVHNGDEELRHQALSAVAAETSRGWRLDKLRASVQIDSIIAGAMASHLAEQDAQHGRGLTVFTETDEELKAPFDDLDEEPDADDLG